MLTRPEHKFNPARRAAVLEKLDRILSELSMAGRSDLHVATQEVGELAERS